MARRPRIEFPGALYHVFARGNHRNHIFLTPNDYEKYLSLVERYKERYTFRLYAYALLSNHLHLLIEPADIPLSKIMQGIQQTYTQFFNWKYGKVGHLFQGRYKAIICQKDTYLLELIRYIHLNPIRAGLVKSIAHYPWTSYSLYLKDRKDRLIDADVVLAQFGHDKKTARRYYQQFVRAGIMKDYREFIDEMVDKRILGDQDFVEEVQQQADEVRHDKYVISEKPELKKILEIVCLFKGTVPVMIKSTVKIEDVVSARRVFIYIARIYFGYQLKEIALFLGIDTTTVMKSVRVMADRIKKEKNLREDIERMLKEMRYLDCQA